MIPGDTFIATVVVRNTGNAQWNDANGFKFGEQEGLDPVVFGPTRYLIDDTQNEIPIYGGIFRGRTITFNIEIIAPETEGIYMTHWGMLQKNVAWFGEILEKNITVSLTAGINERNVQKEFNIYPNPASLSSDIQIDGDFIKNDRIALISIKGEKICEEVILNDIRNFGLTLSGRDIPEGLYFVHIISRNSIQIKKVLVQK